VPLRAVLRDNCLREWVENKSRAAGDWDAPGSPAPLSLGLALDDGGGCVPGGGRLPLGGLLGRDGSVDGDLEALTPEGLEVPLRAVLGDNCLREWVENKTRAARDWDTSGSPAPLSLSLALDDRGGCVPGGGGLPLGGLLGSDGSVD